MAWKADLLATIEERLEAPAVPLPATLDDPAAWNYRRVTVAGQFQTDHVFRLIGRVHDDRVGEELLVPLVRTNPSAQGQIVLVDRGWVPAGWNGELPAGEDEVSGLMRLPAAPGWFQPENQPETNQWFTIDLDRISEILGNARVFPMVLYEDAGPEGQVPIGGQLRVTIPNDHLSYALTWYGLAVVLLVIYILFHIRRPEENQ